MKKQYIKLNNNDEHLSLGNFFRIIKELSTNKSSALQSEIFCSLFDIESINATTVNNYCIGIRNIGDNYKQIFLNKEKKYLKNKNEFVDNIINILSIIDGNIYFSKEIDFINGNESALFLAKKLYNLSKNDKDVPDSFSFKINNYLSENKIYEALVDEILYIVLSKKQPIYETELKKEVIENLLNDTNISAISLQNYLSLKLKEGINYDYSLKKLAGEDNALANYELGCNEYYGYYMGFPRYDIAYKYLIKAATQNHSAANYMIGYMYIKGFIGNKTNQELEKGYQYLLKAKDLGNIAALNVIGNMYYEGIHPLKKDITKAKEMYTKASEHDYVYAFNNLGKIEELTSNYSSAYKYYLESANLGESWACNKVGEYLRKGIIKQDMNLAFEYYNKALESNHNVLCNYSYYNLAKYYYMDGFDVYVLKDINKALEYYKIASKNNIIEASIELFLYYVNLYIKNNTNKNEIMKYKSIIEKHPKFNNEIKNMIEDNINKANNLLQIDFTV